MSATLFVLNGASRAGKTSIAKALQNLLPDPNILLGIDQFYLAFLRKSLDLNHSNNNYLKIYQYTKEGKPYTTIHYGLYKKKQTKHGSRLLEYFLIKVSMWFLMTLFQIKSG